MVMQRIKRQFLYSNADGTRLQNEHRYTKTAANISTVDEMAANNAGHTTLQPAQHTLILQPMQNRLVT